MRLTLEIVIIGFQIEITRSYKRGIISGDMIYKSQATLCLEIQSC